MIQQLIKRVAPIAALAFAASVAGCAYIDDFEKVDGVPLAELDLSGEAPTAIELASPDKVVIAEGGTLTVSVEGDAEAGKALRFDRHGSTLTIARDSEVYDGSGSAIVRITMPAPAKLSIAGSGTIESATMASEAAMEIAGSGGITVATVNADKLDVEIAGSGIASTAGAAKVLSVEIAGSGNVRFGELQADDVSVEIAGAGNVDLASDGKVSAEIAGSGDVRVTGSATCTLSSAGSGKLTCTPKAETEATEPAEAAAE